MGHSILEKESRGGRLSSQYTSWTPQKLALRGMSENPGMPCKGNAS